MNVRLWGTRGSLPTPGPETERYGGNTACIEVSGSVPDHVIVLDAGSGIRAFGAALAPTLERVDVLLSHLHMDHILGLGFFAALFRPGLDVHIWGPSSATLGLHDRLGRYLSPPLFPVRLRDLPCRLTLHDVPLGTFDLPGMEVTAALVCHPGPTVGYRLDDGGAVLAYLPDHEPALGARRFPEAPRWTSGYRLAAEADVLVHDAQYDADEYQARLGWGHSTVDHALAFAEATGVRELVAFHHDPAHDDRHLDAAYGASQLGAHSFVVSAAREGTTFEVIAASGRPNSS
jgi:phosphoribosyl 1,2-cyclic phosphodiesterase